MFGSVGDWLYQSLAGIRQPESSTGYRQIVFQPPPSNVLLFSGTPPPVRRRAQAIDRRSGRRAGLRGVNASLEWLAGRVASSWFIADDGSSFTVRVSVPSQSTANVTIPLLDYSAFVITESGRPVWRDNGFVPGVPGVQAARATNEAVVFSVASGNYVFVIANGKTSVMTCGEAGENQMLYLSCPDPGQARCTRTHAAHAAHAHTHT
jgi:alpha-L-rhamnosidase